MGPVWTPTLFIVSGLQALVFDAAFWRWSADYLRACGNFDIILNLLSHGSFDLYRPARPAWRALLGDHGHRMLIRACNPMLCPIWGFRCASDGWHAKSRAYLRDVAKWSQALTVRGKEGDGL